MKDYDLIHANCLDIEILSPESVHLTITSPPYNVGIDYNSNEDDGDYCAYLRFTQAWLANLYHWTKDTGRLCLNIPLDKNKGGQKSVGADITTLAKEVGWRYHSTIVWNEGNISRRTAWGSWKSASAPYVIAPVELILILYKNQWTRKQPGQSDIGRQEFMDWTNGLWTFKGESKKRVGHPAPFPRLLPRRCIKLFSFVGDVVLDPFAGSGTTLIEALNHKRRAVGIELDKEYCKLAQARIIKECFGKLDI